MNPATSTDAFKFGEKLANETFGIHAFDSPGTSIRNANKHIAKVNTNLKDATRNASAPAVKSVIKKANTKGTIAYNKLNSAYNVHRGANQVVINSPIAPAGFINGVTTNAGQTSQAPQWVNRVIDGVAFGTY